MGYPHPAGIPRARSFKPADKTFVSLLFFLLYSVLWETTVDTFQQ